MVFSKDKNSQINSFEAKHYEIIIFLILMFQFVLVCPRIDQLSPMIITPYFFSYQDFGFNSRFFVGSILKLFSEYIGTTTLYYGVIVIITGVIALIAVILGNIVRRKSDGKNDSLLVIIALFLAGPFSVSFLFDQENFAVFDLYLVIINVISILIVRHKYLKWLIPLLCFIAVAIHQAYIMLYFPAIAVLVFYECYINKFNKSGVALCVTTYTMVVLSAIYFQFFVPGLDFENPDAVVSFLNHRTDFALSSDMIFAEYFMNVDTWGYDVFRFILKTFAFPYSAWVFIATFPVIAILISVWLRALRRAEDKTSKFIVLLCLIAPAAALPMFLGNDWDRWISAIFISQYMLLFYFYNADFICVSTSLEKAGSYFKKHRMVLLLTIAFLSMSMFSEGRRLFIILQYEARDVFTEMLEKYKAVLDY